MATQTQLKEAFGLDIPAHITENADVPVLNGPQRQGDIRVLPAKCAAGDPVPPQGIVLVKGEAMGNTHLLLPGDGVTCRVLEPRVDDLKVAEVSVAEGAEAYLHHIEHGYVGLAPGSYIIKRQREQADEIRLVAD